jgi:release factor glutamine methyltransferase
MNKIFYNDIELEIFEQVYEPREDSYLLADNLKVNEGMKVLDIGTGSGLQAIICAKQGANVIATDINPEAIKCAKRNAENTGVAIEFLQGNLFEPIKGKKFDLIIFNSPYLPEGSAPKEKTLLDLSYAGADKINIFLDQYKNHLEPEGRALLVHSSLSKIKVPGKIISAKKVAFEEIVLSELE